MELVWKCDASEVFDMYGDEPWSEFGGNEIIENANTPELNDSGCDGYADKYGDQIVTQWAQWEID